MLLRGILLFSVISVALAYNNGVGLKPPLGWNTWCTEGSCDNPTHGAPSLHDVCSEPEIKSVAEAMLTNGMYDAGYRYINLDDCWAAMDRDSQGRIQADPDRFPKGIAELTAWLHARGLFFGLYTSAGATTCSQGNRPRPIPGSFGHYTDDAQSFADWGVDYVKIDWCGNNCTDSEKQHTEFSNALNATGRPIFLELCRGYAHPPPAYTHQVANSWRVNGDHHDNWKSTDTAIQGLAGVSQCGIYPNSWNYGDFLMTGGAGCDTLTAGQHCPGMTDIEYKSEFSLWAIVASPLLVATDIRNMTTVMREALLNTEILSVNQDYKAIPGDHIGGWKCSQGEHMCQLWGRQLSDGRYAAVLFNRGDQHHNITLPFDLFGWSGATVSVRDLWEHKELGTVTGSFTASVVSHGVSFVVLEKRA